MTNSKKIGFGIIGLVLVGAIYYFSVGSTQISNNIKAEVKKELASMQTQGFSVETKKVSEKKEYFVLSFDEPKKITAFLAQKGAQLSIEDVQALQGLKVGVEVSYLADVYSSVSFDVYPLTLPTSFETENKKLLKQIEQMLDKKAFLVHIDVNKLGNGFKGYMKDINEVLKEEQEVRFKTKSLTFSGDLKDDKLKSVKQTLKHLTILVADEFTLTFDNMKSNYALTGITNYDYTSDYSIEKIAIDAGTDIQVHLKDILMRSTSEEKNNLLNATMQTEIKHIQFVSDNKKTTLDSILFDMKASNLDISAFEKFENIDPDDEKAMIAVFQQLISKGVRLDMPNFSVEKMEIATQKMDGFKMSTSLDIDKSLDLSTLEKNPMLAIDAINANLDLSIADSLFAFISTQPQAMILMMMVQPKSINGQKVYQVELKNGKLSVNGKPML